MPEGLKGIRVVEIPLRHGQVTFVDRPELIAIHRRVCCMKTVMIRLCFERLGPWC